MPMYEYGCESCGAIFDKRVKLADRNKEQECPECGSTDVGRRVTPVNFNLPGDDWVGKNLRIKDQMRKKNERLKRKEDEMKRDAPVTRLMPNVGGERVGSWSEAAKLAKSRGKDTSGYKQLARKEKAEKQ